MDSDQATRRTLSNVAYGTQKLGWWLRYRGLSDIAADLLGRVKRLVKPDDPSAEASRQESYRDFDRRYGVDTTGWISPTVLSQRGGAGTAVATAEQYSGYQGVEEAPFRRALDRLDVDFSSYTFVDYGSGKGKSLLLASRYPFREIIGVELVPELHEAALENIAAFRDEERCPSIRSVLMDAGKFQPPPGPLVCFLFDPFGPPVMHQVIDRLLRQGRPVYVLYANPKFQKMFLRAGFELQFREKGFRNISVLALFEAA